MAPPTFASEHEFNTFLDDFRHLYEVHHWGKHLPQSQVDRIALRIWDGSGHNWLYASTAACQGIAETHFEISPKVHIEYLGHIGLRKYVAYIEAVRIGMIKSTTYDSRWLIKQCRKDPSLADELATSRLVFLIHHYGNIRIAIFQYVRGYGWKTKPKDLEDCTSYCKTVESLRLQIFN